MEAIKALLFTSLTQIPSFLKQDVFIKDEEQKIQQPGARPKHHTSCRWIPGAPLSLSQSFKGELMNRWKLRYLPSFISSSEIRAFMELKAGCDFCLDLENQKGLHWTTHRVRCVVEKHIDYIDPGWGPSLPVQQWKERHLSNLTICIFQNMLMKHEGQMVLCLWVYRL